MNKKDSKSKFIFVGSDEIKKSIYTTRREYYCNDFYNVYIKTGEQSLDTIFDSYDLPIEYRKLVIKINGFWPFISEGEDYIAKKKYDILAKKKPDFIFIKGDTKGDNDYYFKTIMDQASYKEIMEFYNKLKDEGLLKTYINAISNFYGITRESKNIEKYNEIMSNYRDGEYGDKILSLDEILTISGQKDLIAKMNLQELQYLLDKSSGIIKIFFAEEIKKRLDKTINDTKANIRVKSINKK